ncbi:uncharacterized protein NECHADRAFT_85226 [Fusarium vanettenii 77-13-4]|uniref:Uncharacterized protein n=1 Tax=Fusarium vanettenii (strain ATCC MYA-4622 / CBS 123669 / FGSC 9596 / NRRL 45880 / 77-13-4) TaxID=660122 RepID=C7YVC4_FUSV7|nr:uncharacterized protein NECHADRAFT_85226 [Fusarium vanettenii 77-13-4]EEU44958.1 hypothetical protein NECHADRAFT_85226 [Fusarium vanettenii 77-13-4]
MLGWPKPNFGFMYWLKGDLAAAKTTLVEVLRTGKILYGLCNLLESLGRFDESLDFHLRCLEQYKKVLGMNHHRVGDSRPYLASELARTTFKRSKLHRLMGENKDADEVLDKAYSIRKRLSPGDTIPSEKFTEDPALDGITKPVDTHAQGNKALAQSERSLLFLSTRLTSDQTSSTMSLAPAAPRLRGSQAKATKKKQNPQPDRLRPEEYANAVLGYSKLSTGAGQNHISLAQYLHDRPATVRLDLRPNSEEFVTLYLLGIEQIARQSSSQSSRHHSPSGGDPPENCIIFLRGFMTAQWINNIGARYLIDPEFFCRHLDFSPVDDNASAFSIPSLPSSCVHLIELPVFTIGKRTGSTSQLRVDRIDQLRREGVISLSSHYHEISKLSSSQMQLGDSMVRNFYVFDETYFAIEQRISICLQRARGQKSFTLLVWLDAGTDFPNLTTIPWSVRMPESYYLPVIRHKPNLALKCHLFAGQPSDRMGISGDKIQSLSNLSHDYGRSLRPKIKAKDAFYNLNEIFNFAASSQVQFLNLIDAKLDSYISRPADQEYESLPDLKYTKEMLYRHLQKTKQVLESIRNTRLSTWPKDGSDSSKADIAAKSVEQDYEHILERTISLHIRTTEAITVLMSSMSISESQRAIGQAQRVGKLTFLAFIFVPLSFTTSFFGMNVTQIEDTNLGIWSWFVMSAPIVGLVFTLYFVDVAFLWDKHVRARRGLS